MDQTTARRLAYQVGGFAVTESRWRGRWSKPGEPWIVVVGTGRGALILREVPGEEER